MSIAVCEKAHLTHGISSPPKGVSDVCCRYRVGGEHYSSKSSWGSRAGSWQGGSLHGWPPARMRSSFGRGISGIAKRQKLNIHPGSPQLIQKAEDFSTFIQYLLTIYSGTALDSGIPVRTRKVPVWKKHNPNALTAK